MDLAVVKELGLGPKRPSLLSCLVLTCVDLTLRPCHANAKTIEANSDSDSPTDRSRVQSVRWLTRGADPVAGSLPKRHK